VKRPDRVTLIPREIGKPLSWEVIVADTEAARRVSRSFVPLHDIAIYRETADYTQRLHYTRHDISTGRLRDVGPNKSNWYWIRNWVEPPFGVSCLDWGKPAIFFYSGLLASCSVYALLLSVWSKQLHTQKMRSLRIANLNHTPQHFYVRKIPINFPIGIGL